MDNTTRGIFGTFASGLVLLAIQQSFQHKENDRLIESNNSTTKAITDFGDDLVAVIDDAATAARSLAPSPSIGRKASSKPIHQENDKRAVVDSPDAFVDLAKLAGNFIEPLVRRDWFSLFHFDLHFHSAPTHLEPIAHKDNSPLPPELTKQLARLDKMQLSEPRKEIPIAMEPAPKAPAEVVEEHPKTPDDFAVAYSGTPAPVAYEPRVARTETYTTTKVWYRTRTRTTTTYRMN